MNLIQQREVLRQEGRELNDMGYTDQARECYDRAEKIQKEIDNQEEK